MNNKGKHAISDIYLNKPVSDKEIIFLCSQAITKSGLTVVKKLEHFFKPHGVTVVWILNESHFTLHTYPEHNYISVDCYTCGDEGTPQKAISFLLDILPVKKSKQKNLERG